jgi:hypothetical protein
MNTLTLIKAILNSEQETEGGQKDSNLTFLEIGKPYLFRSVTMIYTGRLQKVSAQEFLITEAAWIPDTERWMDAVTKSAFKEIEPYGSKPVVLSRGAMLDVVEIPELITKQK